VSRWFRHYAGMMRDEKLVSAAIRSKQPIERVVWVWGCILESASEIDDGGRYEIDHAEMAYFLRANEGDVAAVEDALDTLGRVLGGVVANWKDRQFQSDRSAERQKRYRERHKGSGDDNGRPSGDGGVTAASRHGDAPDTETELETDYPSSLRSDGAASKPTPRSELETVLDTEHAKAVVEHRQRLRKPLTAHAAKLLAKSLSGFPDPNAAADTMIESGWQKIKPGWGEDAKARAGPAKRPAPMDHFTNYASEINGQTGHDGRIGSDWDDAPGLPVRTIEHHG